MKIAANPWSAWRFRFGIACLGATLVQAAVTEPSEALPGVRAVCLAIQDLSGSFPDRYPRGAEWLKQVEDLELRAKSAAPEQLAALAAELAVVRKEALLANPLLDFDRLLLVKRNAGRLALPQNWESNSSIPRQGIDNEILVLRGLRGSPVLEPFYQPEGKRFVGDLSLHFDATRLMFSSIGPNGRWGIFEMSAAGGSPRQLPLIPDADVDNYTSCYLPDDSIIFTSTAPLIGVPCVRGGSHVAQIYRYWPDTGRIRRLAFDQEHTWCPTVMPDGRLLYTAAHYFL
jgi:hypothetical protein